MTTDTVAAKKPQKIHRVQIGANVIIQIALLLFLGVMVNYLGFEHYRRWDFSRDHRFAISDKTKRFLDSINGKARITIFFAPNNPIAGDVQSLLTEYQYASRGKIDIETIDPVRNYSRAKEVFEKYKIVSGESLVIIDYDGRNKTVKASDMAEMEPGNPMSDEQPKIGAFKGEQAITSALMDLVEGKKNIIGYVLGHKEPVIAQPSRAPMSEETEGSPIGVLRTFIENENIKVQELNLFDVPAIPAEIKTVFIDGPQYDFSEREMQLLRDFWNKQGRILFLIDPGAIAKTPKLNAFVNELGVKINDDRLMAMVKTGIQEVARVRDVVGRFTPDSPITKRLADVQATFLGGTSSLTLQADRVRAANVQLQSLATAEKGYWAESDYNSTDVDKMQADAAKGSTTLHTFAASIEKGGSGDEHVQTNSSRMVVVGNASFILDANVTQDQQALDFISGGIDWLTNREQLIGIAPKVTKPLTFSLEDNVLRNLRWIVLVLMPLIPAAIGVTVWWERRA